MDRKKRRISIFIFSIIMTATLYTLLHGKNIKEIYDSVKTMNKSCLLWGSVSSFLFITLEGLMMGILLKVMGERASFLRCVEYSFTGFFYSAITPSATGGQPMQLYYLKKDGCKMFHSTVALMTIAFLYKFVLVVIGIVMLFFWKLPLMTYLDNFYSLYLFGILLNIVLVITIGGVMLSPNLFLKVGIFVITEFGKRKIFKEPELKSKKWIEFISSYKNTVGFIRNHKGILSLLFFLTLLQRSCAFFITWQVYRGFGLSSASAFTVMALQASVYIAVDMLPIPGSQGITEAMYMAVFARLFPKVIVLPSLLASRSISFYLPFLFSMLVSCKMAFRKRNKR